MGAVRSDSGTTIAGVLDSEDAENALFVFPQDLTHLRDQQLKQGGTLIALSVPEREPDQTFEIVILAFTRNLPSKEALAIAPGDA